MDYSERTKALSAVLKALGHPARLFMAEKLKKGPQCVCELTALVGMDISTVSRHLTVMREAGVVDMEKKGTMVIYSLSDPAVIDCLETLTSLVKERTWKAS